MKKLAVYLPEDLYHQLAQRAAQQGASVEELVRFAVTQTYLRPPAPPAAAAPTIAPAEAVAQPKAKPPAAPKTKVRRRHPAGLPLLPSVPPQPATPREPVPDELYVRHQTVDEALYRLDAYLDAAFLAGHVLVRVVHGKGGGILKRAIWQRLKEHPLVRSYRLAQVGDGDAGVTVVELVRR